jgi:hypothetical protein
VHDRVVLDVQRLDAARDLGHERDAQGDHDAPDDRAPTGGGLVGRRRRRCFHGEMLCRRGHP